MSTSQSYVYSWMMHRGALIDLVALIPEDQAHFKPYPEGMSLGELVLHIAGSANMFAQAVKTGILERPSSRPTFASMTDVKRLLDEYTEGTRRTIAELTDEQLDASIDTTKLFGFALTGRQALETSRTHEVHHKGQLYVYAHLVGVEKPPMYIKRG